MPYKEAFFDNSYKPKKNDLLALYYLEPAKGTSFELAAEEIAGESSIGTWTEISSLTNEIKERLAPTIFHANKKTRFLQIAYPPELFENGNIPQLMSAVAGNIFGMSSVKNLRLLDIEFPESYLKHFKGPAFGVEGIRSLLRVKERPLVGTIIKPKVGLDEKAHAKVAFDAWFGGCDIVKDDENLTSMRFNNFEKRIAETIRLRDKCERETGEIKIYMPNITAPFGEMMRRAEFVKSSGCEYAMVDIVTTGWSALQELRNAGLGLVLHAHRAGHAAFTRNPQHGISMRVVAKLCRAIGMDQLHVGAIVGKMVGEKKEVQVIGEEISESILKEGSHILEQDWLHLKPMLAVCSGGLHPGKVPALMRAMGNNIVIQAGGGVSGHKMGTISGARAMRQAVDATMNGISLNNYAQNHSELKIALKQWGK